MQFEMYIVKCKQNLKFIHKSVIQTEIVLSSLRFKKNKYARIYSFQVIVKARIYYDMIMDVQCANFCYRDMYLYFMKIKLK